jgi:hypothetical protein
VYWTTSDALLRASDSSFTASPPLYSNVDILGPLALSATDIYFLEDGIGVTNDELHKLARSGGSPQTIRSNLSGASTLSIDGTTLYVSHGLTLEKSALASPTSTTPVDTAGTNVLASGGGRACWVTHPDPNVQTRELWCSVAGGKQRFATATQAILDLAMSSSSVFWIAQDSVETQVWSHNFVTGQQVLVGEPPSGSFAISLAVDASTVYWLTTDDTNGEVWQRPI